MRLNLPTDRLILEQLAERPNLAVNIAASIDRARGYINTRMGYLRDYELVRTVGQPNSGLYELTPRGAAVIALADEYEPGREFEERVDERAADFEIVPQQVIDHAADAE